MLLFSLLSAWQLFFIHDLQTCRLESIAEVHSKDVDCLSTHFVAALAAGFLCTTVCGPAIALYLSLRP